MYSLQTANSYAATLISLQRYGEAKLLLRKTIRVARRVLGDHDGLTLLMRWNYARALYNNDGATLDDLHEAIATLGETATITQRVFGAAHPAKTANEDLPVASSSPTRIGLACTR